MIKNKFLRFLATMLTSIISLVIVSFIDKGYGQPLTFAALAIMFVWGLFFFWRGVIGFPQSKPLQMIKKLFFLIFLIVTLFAFISGIALYYEHDQDGVYSKLAGAILVGTLATYITAVISANSDDKAPFDYAYIVPPAAVLISALGAFILSFVRPYSVFVMIACGLALVGITIYGFKKDWLGFNVTGSTKYSYKPSTSSRSSSSSSSSSQSTYLSPQDAMRVAAQCCEKTRTLSCPAKFFPKITCTFESGCVVFTIGGSVLTNYSGVSRSSIDTALDADLKKLANELETFYQIGIDKLQKQGTSTTSVATAKVMRGNIEIT